MSAGSCQRTSVTADSEVLFYPKLGQRKGAMSYSEEFIVVTDFVNLTCSLAGFLEETLTPPT